MSFSKILLVSAALVIGCGPSWKQTRVHKTPQGNVYEDMRPGHEGECWDDSNATVRCPDAR